MEKQQKSHNFWFGTAMLLLGVVIGFLVAPAKKGVNVKNICGNGWAADEVERLDKETNPEETEEE